MARKTSKTKKLKTNNQTLDRASRQSLGFIVVGCLLLFVVIGYRIQQAARLTFKVQDQTLVSQNKNSPPIATIRLPKYKVNLDVNPASIKDGIWQINESTASHLDQSANPGEEGNIVIYGHNSNQVFGPLRWMSRGEIVELTNLNGEVFTYVVDQIFETNPDDIDWVLPKPKETLTLYTCSGFLNSKRHLVIALPITP